MYALKKVATKAELFEIDIDSMRVKGDLTVIRNYFGKPMIAKSTKLDLLKRGVKSGMQYVEVPYDLELDPEFLTLAKNKDCQIILSYINEEATPSYEELLEILKTMKEAKPSFYKIFTKVENPEDLASLLQLLKEPDYLDKLIVAGTGSKELQIEAPLHGSVFYYATIDPKKITYSDQLTQAELESEWAKR